MSDYELAKKLFYYEPETGKVFRIAKLTWKRNIKPCKPREIKDINNYGYIQVSFQGRPFGLHRIIFLLMTGSFPANDVDHIDGDRLNNKWENLREVARCENLRNIGIKSSNSTGYHGVSFRKDTGKFTVYIDFDGVRYRGGSFTDLKDAVNKRREMETSFGFHENHGKRLGWQKN